MGTGMSKFLGLSSINISSIAVFTKVATIMNFLDLFLGRRHIGDLKIGRKHFKAVAAIVESSSIDAAESYLSDNGFTYFRDELAKEYKDHYDWLGGARLTNREYAEIEHLTMYNQILAIKDYREIVGCGLKEAKNVIDSLRAELIVPMSSENFEAIVDDLINFDGEVDGYEFEEVIEDERGQDRH